MHVYLRWARSVWLAFAVCATLALGLMSGQAAAAPDLAVSAGAGTGTSTPPAVDAEPHYTPADCGAPQEPGFARCFALIQTDSQQRVITHAAAPPQGSLGPADIQNAYHLPADRGNGEVVAIVVAFGNSKAEEDLAVFRSFYGLPPCTTENGCFTKVDQDGGTNYPRDDQGWAMESALDLDAVSAACPKCHILLVQADDNDIANMGIAVDTAVRLGAKYVSNSYGVLGEFPQESDYDRHYDHPGVAVTASTGDVGNVTNWPATNPNVVAIGGTTLSRDASNPRGWHETVWAGAGSGCSPWEPKPDYQQSVTTNCDNRAIGDISAVADPNTGLAVYHTLGQDGWLQVGGTSLSSPLIAAMYALAGAPTPGTYPVTYPYDPTRTKDLFDITEGRNGTCGNVLCVAGPGWDGPTGLGTPNGIAALRTAPHGDITGTVTDSATGTPIAGVAVTTAEGYQATTNSDGDYRISVEVGTYDVSAQMFGYSTQTRTGVTVTEDQTIDVDFTLTAQPSATVEGVVTDGSGQGWPVYAKITIDGYPGRAIYTDPFTGHYSVNLPKNASYTMHVGAVDMPGYQSQNARIDLGDSGKEQDVALAVDLNACTAPGYNHQYDGETQRFTGWTGTDAHHGWTVTNPAGGRSWSFDNPSAWPAPPNSDHDMAIIDAKLGSPGQQDTSLVSASVDLSGVIDPVVEFDTYYYGFNSTGDVDISLDGGATWSNLWHETNQVVASHVRVPIPQAVGKQNVQVRFHYRGFGWYFWSLDNVFVGARPQCVPSSGGLVTGLVRDNNTGAAVTDARVSSDDRLSDSALTRAIPNDPNLGSGYYWMFSSLTGGHSFSANRGGYVPDTARVEVAAGRSVRQDFTLKAGHLTVSSDSIEQTRRIGDGPQRQTVTFGNDGTEPVHVTLFEQHGAFTPMAGFETPGTGAPLQMVKGHFAPGLPAAQDLATGHAQAAQEDTPSAGPWTDIADLPAPVLGSAVAAHDGKVYSVGGNSRSGYQSAGYVYNPAAKAWSRIADLPKPLASTVGAFAGNRMYVIGGGNTDLGSGMFADVFAYDPVSNAWAKRASLPEPLGASAGAVMGGQVYVVGGCNDTSCRFVSSAAYRYDPNSDRWTRLADYPGAVLNAACGGVAGGIVCAGGAVDGKSSAATYRYDPRSDRWTRVANMPYDNWAMAYSTANGKLQVAAGVSQGAVINRSAEYDPATDTWSALPNANHVAFHARGACGMYKIGGWSSSLEAQSFAEVLPGHDQCDDTGADVPWLSASTTGFDVKPGTTVAVTVTTDSASLGQPGDYTAALRVTTDSPYTTQPVGVSLHLDPAKGWGKLNGVVTDAATHAPIAGAMVQITGTQGKSEVSYTLKTDKDGYYQLWLDSKYQLRVVYSKDDYLAQVKQPKLKQQATTTVNVALTRWSAP